MKKCFNYFIIVLCSFFFISVNAFAASLTDAFGSLYVNTDKQPDEYSDRLNLFNLVYNESGFAQNLLLQGTNFVEWSFNELNLSISDIDDSSNFYMSLVSVSDFNNLTMSKCNNAICDDFTTISSSSYDKISGYDILSSDSSADYFTFYSSYYIFYLTVFLDDYDSSDVSYVMLISVNANSFGSSSIAHERDISFNFDVSGSYFYVYLQGYFDYFVYYNVDGDVIGYSHIDYSNINHNANNTFFDGYWWLVIDQFNSSSYVLDMTSWYSYAFKTTISSNYFEKMYAYYFYLPGYDDYVMLSGNAGVGTVVNFFRNIFLSNYLYVDLSKYDLNFIYTYPFYKSSGYYTMWDYWFNSSNNSVYVPDDFEYIKISNYDKGYYLTPISGCTADNYMLYYYSNNSAFNYKLYFNYFNFDTDSLSLVYNSSYYAYASVDYYMYSYSPLVDLSLNSLNFSNILINIYQNSVLFDYFVYYNPSCYNVYDSSSVQTLVFSDDLSYELSLTEQASMYSSYNVNGGNYIGSSEASSATSNTLDNGTYDGYSISSATSASDLLATATSSISGITGTISGIVTMGTVFFTGLPSGMQSVLYTFFILGFVIVILKMLF